MKAIHTTVLAPLNFCMYCGALGADVKLTDEHVMARGLNGTLLFPKSSCTDPCQKMIGTEIETPILKQRWLAHSRSVMGLRSYKPSRQAKHVKMTFVGHDGLRFKVNIPKKDAAALICLPLLVTARALVQADDLIDQDGLEIRGTCDAPVHNRTLDGDFDYRTHIVELCRRFNARAVDLNVELKPGDLCRFLCKTAYGFHVAERGTFCRTESPALAIMKAERTDYSNWIGSEELPSAPPGKDLHDLSIEDAIMANGQPCTIVKIHLFAAFGVDIRYVIVTRADGWRDMTKRDPNPIHRSGKIALVSED